MLLLKVETEISLTLEIIAGLLATEILVSVASIEVVKRELLISLIFERISEALDFNSDSLELITSETLVGFIEAELRAAAMLELTEVGSIDAKLKAEEIFDFMIEELAITELTPAETLEFIADELEEMELAAVDTIELMDVESTEALFKAVDMFDLITEAFSDAELNIS